MYRRWYTSDTTDDSPMLVSTDDRGLATVPVMNLSDVDYTIKKGQTVIRGVLFTEDKIQTTNREVNTEPIRIDEIISDLSSDQVENVCIVLN